MASYQSIDSVHLFFSFFTNYINNIQTNIHYSSLKSLVKFCAQNSSIMTFFNFNLYFQRFYINCTFGMKDWETVWSLVEFGLIIVCDCVCVCVCLCRCISVVVSVCLNVFFVLFDECTNLIKWMCCKLKWD